MFLFPFILSISDGGVDGMGWERLPGLCIRLFTCEVWSRLRTLPALAPLFQDIIWEYIFIFGYIGTNTTTTNDYDLPQFHFIYFCFFKWRCQCFIPPFVVVVYSFGAKRPPNLEYVWRYSVLVQPHEVVRVLFWIQIINSLPILRETSIAASTNIVR